MPLGPGKGNVSVLHEAECFEIDQKWNIAVNCFTDKESNVDFSFVLLAFPLYLIHQFWDLMYFS